MAFKITAIYICVCVCVCVYVLDPFHLQRVNKLYWKYKPVKITQKEHMLIWNSETTQKPKHLSSPNRSSYFSSYKAWKNNYDMQLFKFLHTENTSKQQRMVAFMNMVLMLLRQFRRLAQGHCWSYANSLKQLILKLRLSKNILSSLLPAYWRYKSGFCFFPDK